MILSTISELVPVIVFMVTASVLSFLLLNWAYKLRRRFDSYYDYNRRAIVVDVKANTLSKQNVCIDILCRFGLIVCREKENFDNALKYVIGFKIHKVEELAKDIISRQLRLAIATMTIEEINSNRAKFMDNISKYADLDLKKIGLKIRYISLIDIKDEYDSIKIKTHPTIPQLFVKLLKKMKLK